MLNYWLCRKRQREDAARKAAAEETEINFLSNKKWTPNKMGIGTLGSANMTFRSKFRWTLELRSRSGTIVVPEQYVKLKCRPHFADAVQHYTFTKPDLSLSVTYLDIKDWNFWNMHKKIENLSKFYTDATLRLYDNSMPCGNVLESWMLYTVQTGRTDLRLTEDNVSVLDVTFKFKTAQYQNYSVEKWNQKWQRTPM